MRCKNAFRVVQGAPHSRKYWRCFGHENKILLPSLGFEPRTSRLLLYPVKERLQVRIPPGAKRFFRSGKIANFLYCEKPHTKFFSSIRCSSHVRKLVAPLATEKNSESHYDKS